MSIFLTRPHASRPRWQKLLIIARNWLGWFVPAAEYSSAYDMSLRVQLAAGILVGGQIACQLTVWVSWVYSPVLSPTPLWLVLSTSVFLYLAMGASFHSMLLQIGGCYHTEPRPRPKPLYY